MKALLKIKIAAMMVMAMAGCNKTTPVLFEDTTMGFVEKDYSFTADDGMVFDFGLSEGSQEYYVPGNRLLISCYAEEKTGNNSYKATLSFVYKPIYKDAVKKSVIKDWGLIGDDNSNLKNCWYSGGCLNMYASIGYSAISSVTHSMNLVVDDTKASKDTLYVDFRHNAYGDVSEDEEAVFYASFPVKDYLKGTETTVSIRNRNVEDIYNYISLK